MDVEPKILKELELHEEEEKNDVVIKYKRLRKYFRLCESPIEQIFLYHILNFTPYRFSDCYSRMDVAHNRPVILCRPWDIEEFGDFNVKIIAQHVIKRGAKSEKAGKYRTDFTFEVLRDVSTKELTEDDYISFHRNSEVFARLVVEIDGHDFHKRTKEQARRDKSRDRFMTLEGYTILRFTGSEIYREPTQAANEVEQFITNVMVKAERNKVSPIDMIETGRWLNLDFEMKRYTAKKYGRKDVHGV